VSALLAVDVGIRSGLALYGADGRLVWYRSHNYGSAPRLRRAAHGLLESLPRLRWLVVEGGGPLAEIWSREADRHGIDALLIGAERWREQLLHDRERRTGVSAKAHAAALARRIIEWSEAPRPTSLRHDAAEAIVIGFWGALETGLLEQMPAALRR
jgi:hypothetical protein